MVLIEECIRHIVQIVAGGITEDKALQNRWQNKSVARARIFEDRKDLLADQGHGTRKAFPHAEPQASFLRVARILSTSKTTTMPASTAEFGRMIAQLSPARKIVWSSETK